MKTRESGNLTREFSVIAGENNLYRRLTWSDSSDESDKTDDFEGEGCITVITFRAIVWLTPYLVVGRLIWTDRW